MDIFQLIYRAVDDTCDGDFIQNGNHYCVGMFSSKENALDAIKADIYDGEGGELATRDDVPDAGEGMVRVVDGKPRGFYEVISFPLDKTCWTELVECV